MSIRDRLIHIHACRGVTWLLIKKFLTFDPTLKEIYKLSKMQLRNFFEINERTVDLLFIDLQSVQLKTKLKRLNEVGIGTLTIFDSSYPYLLKQIYDPPWVLYWKGDLSLLKIEKKISVVGSRSPSKNGILSLHKVVLPLVEDNWLIVSGMAIGIDAQAHLLAINNDGKTIAVLGSGFNHIYPQCHKNLSTTIAENHLLISEFPPYQKPQKWNFPMRNRIISGLTKGTIIIEARKKSGSLITADLALQQGRDIFAIPGSILDEQNEGTHWLIQQGAKLTKCSEDVLNEM